jgi:rhodanese-related sulfurtransferase
MSKMIVTPQELKKMMDDDADFVLVDVREDSERLIAKIDFGVHIPMGDIASRQGELDPEADIVVYCHSGMRSFQVCRLLEGFGFAKVRNLVGGITAWSTEIDPSIQKY